MINTDMRLSEIENIVEGWEDTSWSNDEVTVSIKDLLNGPLKNIPTKKLNVKDLAPLLISSDDSARSEKADLQYPIIVTVNNGKYNSILDGNHRLQKAIKNNIPTINGRVLDLSTLPSKYASLFNAS